jgi:hypothetical protein
VQPISGFPTRIHMRFSFIPCMLHDRTNSNLHYPIFFSLFALRYCLPVLSRRPSHPVLPAPSVYNLVQCVTRCCIFFCRPFRKYAVKTWWFLSLFFTVVSRIQMQHFLVNLRWKLPYYWPGQAVRDPGGWVYQNF